MQTGLPQMLMLLLFNCAAYMLVRAIQSNEEGENYLGWIAGMSFFFGLLALTHSITLWLFAGALFFCLLHFPGRSQVAAVMLTIVLLMYVPWMVREYHVSGNLAGTAGYSVLYGMRGTESQIMRDTKLGFSGLNPLSFRNKVLTQSIVQFGRLNEWFGFSLIAPVFFISLLHPFKNPSTSVSRWAIIAIWLFAVLGMSVFGFDDDPTSGLHANDLHVLFIPLFVAYGLALIMVMWSRWEIRVWLVEYGFLALLFIISGLPMINSLIGQKAGIFQWPPYLPVGIAKLNDFTTDREIIMSDMPAAVAWYADRKSLWLPATIDQFVEYHDYGYLGAPVVGMFLTPVTGNQPFISGLNFGEYKEWRDFILRQASVKDFPFHAVVPMGIESQYIFYADHDRWTVRRD
jgi:hypothetical protein